MIEQSIELGLRLKQREGPGILSSYAASVPLASGDLARASELAEQGLAIAREIEVGVFVAPHIPAQVALAEGDLDGATRLFEEGLRVSVELGGESSVAFYLQGLRPSPPGGTNWSGRRSCGERRRRCLRGSRS